MLEKKNSMVRRGRRRSLAALHKVLALVDDTAFFPRLDRGLAEHRVILGLHRADARDSPLFEDDR